MHILVTRPKSDAAELKATLEALGHEVTLEPLLGIVSLPIAAEVLDGAQGIIATSRNGLRALADSEAVNAARALPLFAVGEATAETARSMGFENITAGPGTGAELVPIIAAAASPKGGPLVHVAGEVVAFDLAGALAAQGYEVRKVTAYRAEPATELSEPVKTAISAGQIDTVILMSPRTAAIFCQLADTTDLKDKARRLTFLCLSAGIAEKLDVLAPARVEVAEAPNTRALLGALARMAPPSSGV